MSPTAPYRQVLMRSLGFTVRRKEVPLIVHHANPDSDGSVDLQTFRRISKSPSSGSEFDRDRQAV